MSDSILKLENLSLNIDGNQILDQISFTMPQGKIVTIIGPNGSGKTSLARCILKLIEPTTGTIWFKPKLRIGYMPQRITLNPNLPLTVLDFLRLEIKYKISKKLLYNIIEEIGVNDILTTPLQKISGGEMQRVLLARALLTKPDLLILDEPVQGVDVNGQVEFYKLIDKLRLEKRLSILIISHDLHMVMKTTDYVICLNHHICCQGTTSFVNQQQNFQELFGLEALSTFSTYQHRHDHIHK